MNKPHYPKNLNDYKKDPGFYEELALLNAQEVIAKLMNKTNNSETSLANLLKKPKNYVKRLLSDGKNLTLKTLARVCFHMKRELDFSTHSIEIPQRVHNARFVAFKSLQDFKNASSWDLKEIPIQGRQDTDTQFQYKGSPNYLPHLLKRVHNGRELYTT